MIELHDQLVHFSKEARIIRCGRGSIIDRLCEHDWSSSYPISSAPERADLLVNPWDGRVEYFRAERPYKPAGYERLEFSVTPFGPAVYYLQETKAAPKPPRHRQPSPPAFLRASSIANQKGGPLPSGSRASGTETPKSRVHMLTRNPQLAEQYDITVAARGEDTWIDIIPEADRSATTLLLPSEEVDGNQQARGNPPEINTVFWSDLSSNCALIVQGSGMTPESAATKSHAGGFFYFWG